MNSLQKFAIDFLDNHWGEIEDRLIRDEMNGSKKKFISLVGKDDELAWWVVTEVMSWGCKTDYLKEHIASEDENKYCVIKCGESYYQNDGNFSFKEVFPKTKTVIYFE